MTKTARRLIISAAIAGLAAGTMAVTGCKSSDSAGTQSTDKAMAKHDCKGMNSCKGMGGCKTASNDCKGMNSCKGKGGCKTT